MRYYSDPTASKALGSINREFSEHEKKAKALCRLCLHGELTAQEWADAHRQFKGIYKHVLDNVLHKMLEEIKTQLQE